MKTDKLERLDKVDVEVVKKRESSGNEQFFVRFSRNDHNENVMGNIKKFSFACFQTLKNNLTKEECLSRAWFEAGMAARFVGLKSLNEVKIIGFTDEETKIMIENYTLFRE